jgi:hypothetical protein
MDWSPLNDNPNMHCIQIKWNGYKRKWLCKPETYEMRSRKIDCAMWKKTLYALVLKYKNDGEG